MTTGSFAESQEKSGRVISMWSGLLSDIPSGWIVCDGNNGTPDLRDRFVRGIKGSNSSPGTNNGTHSYGLGTGQIPSHSHGGSTNTTGSHQHTVEYINYTYGFYNSFSASSIVGPGADTGSDSYDKKTTDSVSAHSHSFSIGKTGSGNSIDNRPAFYEVAFIMKS